MTQIQRIRIREAASNLFICIKEDGSLEPGASDKSIRRSFSAISQVVLEESRGRKEAQFADESRSR
jgi:hypothetical protein